MTTDKIIEEQIKKLWDKIACHCDESKHPDHIISNPDIVFPAIRQSLETVAREAREEERKRIESIVVECDKDIDFACQRNIPCAINGKTKALCILKEILNSK